MNHKYLVSQILFSAFFLAVGSQNPLICKEQINKELSQVKVAVLYENITDGVQIGRSIDETINLLKETKADLIFRGFWKWAPVVDSPDSIPSDLLELAPDGTTLEQAAEVLRESGHYYQELKRWISAIKVELPDIIFVGAIPTQTLARIEYNPVSGKIYSKEETWAMALDPQKWNIMNNGDTVTKEQFQKSWYGVHPYGGTDTINYDRQKAIAYFPDITNSIVQELILSWAKKQIDCGANAFWIDMLHTQAKLLAQMTRDVNHPSVKESMGAASKIVDEIHKYGDSIGKFIYVGSWSGAFVLAKIEGLEFPYSPPNLDFITTAPFNQEVLDKKLDSSRWGKEIPATKKIFGDKPNFAFIDWAFDSSQTVMFSQILSSQEQRDVLKTFDSSFTIMGVNFVYPIHGGFMGNGDITTKLAWGKYRIYDALAPEFQTYQTIKELAQIKATTDVNESPNAFSNTPKLELNFPNPFQYTTNIEYNLPHMGNVIISIYDTQGQSVKTLYSGSMDAGEHTATWDGRTDEGNEAQNGIYFYRIQSERQTISGKMMLIR
jgi:hypothetical protein